MVLKRNSALRFNLLMLVLVASLGGIACGDESDSQPESTDVWQAAAERALRDGGFPFQSVRIERDEDDTWLAIVDDDIVFDLAVLFGMEGLGSEYDLDGYYYNRHVQPITNAVSYPAPYASSVRLVFTSSVSTAWRTAFTQAISQWNSNNPCINISTTNGSETINVRTASLSASVVADARYPVSAFRPPPLGIVTIPGSPIRLNSSLPNIETMSAALKRQVALHELGHALGFSHPTEAHHLPGTSSGTSYPTVMAATLGPPGVTNLSADDIASRNFVFKSPCQ